MKSSLDFLLELSTLPDLEYPRRVSERWRLRDALIQNSVLFDEYLSFLEAVAISSWHSHSRQDLAPRTDYLAEGRALADREYLQLFRSIYPLKLRLEREQRPPHYFSLEEAS